LLESSDLVETETRKFSGSRKENGISPKDESIEGGI